MDSKGVKEAAIYFDIYSTPLDMQKLYVNFDKVTKTIIIQHKTNTSIFSFLSTIFHLFL